MSPDQGLRILARLIAKAHLAKVRVRQVPLDESVSDVGTPIESAHQGAPDVVGHSAPGGGE